MKLRSIGSLMPGKRAITLRGKAVVTTPHEVARQDVHRCINMFEKRGIPITGLVENMVSLACKECGHVESFYSGIGDRCCDIKTIAVFPMDHGIWESSKKGVPFVFDAIGSDLERTFDRLAERLEYRI